MDREVQHAWNWAWVWPGTIRPTVPAVNPYDERRHTGGSSFRFCRLGGHGPLPVCSRRWRWWFNSHSCCFLWWCVGTTWMKCQGWQERVCVCVCVYVVGGALYLIALCFFLCFKSLGLKATFGRVSGVWRFPNLLECRARWPTSVHCFRLCYCLRLDRRPRTLKRMHQVEIGLRFRMREGKKSFWTESPPFLPWNDLENGFLSFYSCQRWKWP